MREKTLEAAPDVACSRISAAAYATNCPLSGFTSLHKLSQREIAVQRRKPALRLGWSTLFTTTHVFTKKVRKARRREGDKCVLTLGFLSAANFPGSGGATAAATPDHLEHWPAAGALRFARCAQPLPEWWPRPTAGLWCCVRPAPPETACPRAFLVALADQRARGAAGDLWGLAWSAPLRPAARVPGAPGTVGAFGSSRLTPITWCACGSAAVPGNVVVQGLALSYAPGAAGTVPARPVLTCGAALGLPSWATHGTGRPRALLVRPARRGRFPLQGHAAARALGVPRGLRRSPGALCPFLPVHLGCAAACCWGLGPGSVGPAGCMRSWSARRCRGLSVTASASGRRQKRRSSLPEACCRGIANGGAAPAGCARSWSVWHCRGLSAPAAAQITVEHGPAVPTAGLWCGRPGRPTAPDARLRSWCVLRG